VPRFKCSSCGLSWPGKMATVYWGWNNAHGFRQSCKQRFDPEHFLVLWAELSKHAKNSSNKCLSCGGDITESSFMAWATIYPPHHERTDAALEVCTNCAESLIEQITMRSEPLADRGAGEGGPLPQPPRVDPWRALGIEPLEFT
jgi:hypothetical protein